MAFAYGENIEQIRIPNTVTIIESDAFYGCTNIEDIIMSNNLMDLKSNVFIDTLWYDRQPDGDVYIGNVYYKYKGTMPEGTSVTIREETKVIAGEAFDGCSALTNVTIPDSVTSIGRRAFYECSGLTSITIPDSVTSIGEATFDRCSGLTSITIPDSVTSIGRRAFYECSGLTSITIPDSITSIEIYSFYGCSGLTSITIPSSVTRIGKYSFYECSGLTTVNYTGTAEQWNQITIEGGNTPLTSATINYNYTGE